MNNVCNTIDVESARTKVGGDEYVIAAVIEHRNGLFTVDLLKSSMIDASADIVGFQEIIYSLNRFAIVCEHYRALVVEAKKQCAQRFELVFHRRPCKPHLHSRPCLAVFVKEIDSYVVVEAYEVGVVVNHRSRCEGLVGKIWHSLDYSLHLVLKP